MKSIALFAIAAITEGSRCGRHGRCGNFSERADCLARSVSDVARAPAPLRGTITIASTPATGQEIARRYATTEGRCGRVRHEKVQTTALRRCRAGRKTRRKTGRKTCRDQSERNQEASCHGSLLGRLFILGRGDDLRIEGIPDGRQIRFKADFWRVGFGRRSTSG